MKRILFLLLSVFVLCCCNRFDRQPDELSIKRYDLTIQLLQDEVITLRDSLNDLKQDVDFWKTTFEDAKFIDNAYEDSLNYLKEDLFIYQYKLARIKEYNAIVERDNSQAVFFRGWIKRVLED